MFRLVIISAVAVLAAGCGSSNRAGLEERGEFYRGADTAAFLEAAAQPALEADYVIGVGDRLDVVFFVHRELSTEFLLVRPDGRITLQYVGDVMAAGHTPMQLDSTLTEKFSEVLRDPNLSVIVRHPAEKMVYVLGQVDRPGGFKFETRVSVLGAVALAGGFMNGAKTTHVILIRRDGTERIVGAEINVAAAASGYNVANDIWLRNYDIVYVPKTRLQSTADFVGILSDIFYKPMEIALRGWQIQILKQQVDYLPSTK